MYHATLHNLNVPIFWNLQSRKDIVTLNLASNTLQLIRKPHQLFDCFTLYSLSHYSNVWLPPMLSYVSSNQCGLPTRNH